MSYRGENTAKDREKLEQSGRTITPEFLSQLFQNRANCYADTVPESATQAMTEDCFVEVVMGLLKPQAFTAGSNNTLYKALLARSEQIKSGKKHLQ